MAATNTHIHAKHVVASQTLYFALFQESQQLRLQAKRKIADFIQKKGSPLGRVNASDFRLHGSGECPLDVAKQLRFQKGFRNGRTVDDHEEALAGAT